MREARIIIGMGFIWCSGYFIGKTNWDKLYRDSFPPKFIEVPKPSTEKEKDSIENLVAIDSTFSIDNHTLIQFNSDTIMHSAMCKECLKRLKP